MDNPNITMEEYIRLEEEKARKRKKVFNWETAKYGKIWYDEDVHNLRSVETKFPAIVFNDNLTSNETLSCEPTISSLNNNEIDFRISFDESDDEDYTVIFDKNSFLKDFTNEFPAIVYNDALTSKSDFLTEPTLSPQHINEFDLKDETSLSEYDEVEQNVLYFNDLFPFNIIYPDDLKSDKDNDDNEIDMIQSLGDIADFEERLERIHDRGTHRVQVLDFKGMPELMRDVLYARMLMEHCVDDGVVVFTSQAYGRVLESKGPLVRKLILEFLSTLRFGEVLLDLDAPGTIQRFAVGRKSGALISGGKFIARLAEHFRLLTEEMLQGLTVTAPALPIIDMTELVRLQICVEFRDTWAWAPVAPGCGDEDEEMPQAVPPLPRTQGERIARLVEEVHGMCEVLQGQKEVLDSMARDLSSFTTWTVTSLSRMIDKAGVTYTRYSESPVAYQRRNVRQRTDGSSTSTAPQQLDP
ncbi:hypothetical protein Tco_0847377 [Tanacetum coccineum]